MTGDTKTRKRGWRCRGMSVGMLILLILTLTGISVGASILEKKHGWRRDFSFNGITTQSETTRKALSELQSPVHIYALFPKGREDAPLMELLDRYASMSDRVTWEQIDPALHPGVLTRFAEGTKTVDSDSLIVYCAETDRWRILSPADFISLSLDEETGTYSYAGYTYERAITSALTYVTRKEIPRIVILQGHGELDGNTLNAFAGLMTENHYEIVYQKLSDSDYEPEPGDTLVFFSPMRDLLPAEAEKLNRFIEKGGSLLFTCDYADPVEHMPQYAAILRYYGFIPKEGIVIADSKDADSYYNGIPINLIPEMKSTDVTVDLVASGADTVLLPGSRAFESPGQTDRNLILFSVLESGQTSYLKSLKSDLSGTEKTEGDEVGPFTLALQAQRTTASGYISRAFIFGCSGMMTEEQIYAMTDAQQLIIRVMEYLAGESASNLDIMARNAVRPALSPRGNTLGSLAVTVLPLSILLAALIVLIQRRNL